MKKCMMLLTVLACSMYGVSEAVTVILKNATHASVTVQIVTNGSSVVNNLSSTIASTGSQKFTVPSNLCFKYIKVNGKECRFYGFEKKDSLCSGSVYAEIHSSDGKNFQLNNIDIDKFGPNK